LELVRGGNELRFRGGPIGHIVEGVASTFVTGASEVVQFYSDGLDPSSLHEYC